MKGSITFTCSDHLRVRVRRVIQTEGKSQKESLTVLKVIEHKLGPSQSSLFDPAEH